MRRKDRETNRNFALYVADKCEWATLAVVTPNGEPYAVPVSIVRDGEAVYFHCAREGFKIDCMSVNPRVRVVCVGDTRRAVDQFTTEYESAVICGTASEVTDEKEKIRILRLLCLRHTPSNMENFDMAIEGSLSRTAVWRVSIDEITGKRKSLK